MKGIDDNLGPLHGKGGNDDLGLVPDGLLDDLQQFLDRLLSRLMEAIPVGRFQPEDIGILNPGGIADNRLIGAAEIS